MDDVTHKWIYRKLRSNLHVWRWMQSPTKVVTFAAAFLLVGGVVAAPGREDAQRAIDGAFGRIQSGAIFTALIDRKDLREPATTLERTYASGSNFRVDTIMDYEPGKLLHNPLVLVELRTSKRRFSAYINFPGDYKTPEEIFAMAVAHPSPEMRMVEDP